HGRGVLAPAQEARRHAGDHGEIGHVLGDHRARAYQAAAADRDARQQDGAGADIGPSADAHRPNLLIGGDNGSAAWQAGVHGAQDFGARPPAHLVANDQVTGIEIALRPNPHPIANDALAVEPALEIGLRANEDPIADLEPFQVLEARAAADAHAVP